MGSYSLVVNLISLAFAGAYWVFFIGALSGRQTHAVMLIWFEQITNIAASLIKCGFVMYNEYNVSTDFSFSRKGSFAFNILYSNSDVGWKLISWAPKEAICILYIAAMSEPVITLRRALILTVQWRHGPAIHLRTWDRYDDSNMYVFVVLSLFWRQRFRNSWNVQSLCPPPVYIFNSK